MVIDAEHILKVAAQIGEAAQAEQVIFFGSYAHGQATEHSDVDLLVIARSALPRYRRRRDLYRQLRPYPFSMDLLVYTPQEIEQAKQSPVSFVSQVLREGKLLYARGV